MPILLSAIKAALQTAFTINSDTTLLNAEGNPVILPSTVQFNPSSITGASRIDASGVVAFAGGDAPALSNGNNYSWTVTPATGAASLAYVNGGQAWQGAGYGTQGGSGTVVFSGWSSDPNLTFTANGGGTPESGSNGDIGGDAIANLTGLTITTLTCNVSVNCGSIGNPSSIAGAGAGKFNCGQTHLTTLNIGSLNMSVGGESSGASSFDASGSTSLTDLSLSSLSIGVNYPGCGGGGLISFQNCALTTASLAILLAACYSAGAYAFTNSFTLDISGGTNAVPPVLPELDTIQIVTPGDGDSFKIWYQNANATWIIFVYDASIPLSGSSYDPGSQTYTIGIQDNPSNSAIAAVVATQMQNYAPTHCTAVVDPSASDTVDLSLGTVTGDGSSLFAASMTSSGGTSPNFNNVQTGVDWVAQLASTYNWSVNHN